MSINALIFENEKLQILDQVKLPFVTEFIVTDDYNIIAEAIENLSVRGAPAIGIAAAFGLALSIKNIEKQLRESVFLSAYERLRKTRPTAVNLFYALEKIKNVFMAERSNPNIYESLLLCAKQIHEEDIRNCELMAANGLQIFHKKSVVLTHCNTGALATGGEGTALSVIKNAYKSGLVNMVYADETRPLFQGSRLTAFELDSENIPFKIITDSTAAFLFQQKLIDLVITGADRIAVNGDAANKIGTYNLAVLCKFHSVPFYIAAPSTTIDLECKSGSEIKIELRDKKELFEFAGTKITNNDYEAYTPAFDVTPSNLITGIITEKGFYKPPYIFFHV